MMSRRKILVTVCITLLVVVAFVGVILNAQKNSVVQAPGQDAKVVSEKPAGKKVETGGFASEETPLAELELSSEPPAESEVVALPEPEVSENDPVIDGPKLIVQGFVKNELGEPVAGATVEVDNSSIQMQAGSAFESEAYATTSDENGHYRLVCEALAFSMIRASAEGYGVASKSFQYMDREFNESSVVNESYDFVLGQEQLVVVKVQDEQGNPLEGVKVSAILSVPPSVDVTNFKIPTKDAESTTDASGVCTLNQLSRTSNYMLATKKTGYRASFTMTHAPHDKPITLTVKAGGASVKGVVLTQGSREPISGAEVKLSIYNPLIPNYPQVEQTTTDGSGEFTFSDLNTGTFTIVASHPDYAPNYNYVQNNPLTENEVRTGVEILLNKGLRIYGVVTNAQTNEPLAGVEIGPNFQMSRLMNRQKDVPTVRTDANGAYELRGFQAMGSALMVVANLKGWAVVNENSNFGYMGGDNVAYKMIEPNETEIELNIQMNQLITVSGRVKTPNNLGLAGVSVSYAKSNSWGAPPKGDVVTDRNGFYSLQATPFSEGVVLAKIKDSVVPSELVTVLGTSVQNVDIVVEKFTEVRGVVLNPDGEPIEGAEVSFNQLIQSGKNSYTYQNTKNLVSDAEGKFVVTNVYPIRSTVMASHKDFAPSNSTEMRLTPGEEPTEVTLKLRVAYELAGVVYDPDGKVAQSANIHLYSQSGNFNNPQNVQTNEKGYFYVDKIPVKNVNVSVNLQGGGYHTFEDIETGNLNVELRMPKINQYTILVSLKDASTGNKILDFKAKSPWGNQSYPVKDGILLLENQQEDVGTQVLFSAEGYATNEQIVVGNASQDPDGDQIVELEYEMVKGVRATGLVLNEATREPIVGAKVELFEANVQPWQMDQNRNTPVGVTDEEGRYSIEHVASGIKTFRVTPNKASNVAPKKLELMVNENGADVETIMLNAGSVLRLKVVDAINQKPLQGKAVSVRQNFGNSLSQNKVTDQKGMAEFQNLTEETHQVQFTSEEMNASINIEAGQKIVEQTIGIGQAAVSGKILKNGKAVAGNISMSSKNQAPSLFYNSKTVNDDEDYEYKNVPPGTWVLRVYPPNWGRELGTLEFTVSPSDEELVVNFELSSASISGRLLLADGSPYVPAKDSKDVGTVSWSLSNSPTFMPDGKGQINVKDDGTYLVEDLAEGDYELVASVPGLGRGLVKTTLKSKSEAQVRDITLVGGGATIVSTVLSYETGAPIQIAWLKLSPVKDTTFTQQFTNRDAEGVLVAEFIPAGTYDVEVSAWGQSINTHTITLTDGETKVMDDVLYASGALRWKLSTSDGKAAEGVSCRLTPLDSGSIETVRRGNTEAESGQFIVRGLFPGSYRAEALGKSGEVLVSLDVEIQAGNLTFKESTLP